MFFFGKKGYILTIYDDINMFLYSYLEEVRFIFFFFESNFLLFFRNFFLDPPRVPSGLVSNVFLFQR